MGRLGLLMLAGAVLAIGAPPMAQAQTTTTRPPAKFVVPPPKLRGPETAPAAPLPLPAKPADQSLDPTLAPPVDSAARLGGLADEPTGGAICRQACARTYYFCLANDQSGSCPTSWTRCQLACPSNSSRQ